MIITQFRKFTPLNMAILLGLGGLLCLGVYLHLPDTLETPLVGPAILQLIGGFGRIDVSPSVNVILTLLITLLQAFYLNNVMNRHNFFARPGFLIALIYLTLASLTLPFLVLSPVLLCNFLLIRMLDKLLHIYQRPFILRDLYDLGVLVGIGSLLYLPFAGMLLAVWSGLRLFRPFNWREWIAPLMGILSIYFLLWVVFFWLGADDFFVQLLQSMAGTSREPIRLDSNDYVILFPVLVITVLFLVTLRQTIFKRIVHIRKAVILLFVLLLVSLGTYFLRTEPGHYVAHFLLAVPSLSIYMAYYFNYASNKWVYEGVYLLLFLMILIFHVL